jgi:hypothetical protein
VAAASLTPPSCRRAAQHAIGAAPHGVLPVEVAVAVDDQDAVGSEIDRRAVRCRIRPAIALT